MRDAKAAGLSGGMRLGRVGVVCSSWLRSCWVCCRQAKPQRTSTSRSRPTLPVLLLRQIGRKAGPAVGTDRLYRDPSCVPADFNLLDFFDIPRAFGCPLAVQGFEIWQHGPGQEPAPIQVVESQGLGVVPVWFVSPSEYESATADGVLTIGELRALPSLQTGAADSFQEVLHQPKVWAPGIAS